MAFAEVEGRRGERGGEGLDRGPDLGEGDAAAGRGVDEGGGGAVRTGRDEGCYVEGGVGWEGERRSLAVEGRVRGTVAASWID